MMEEEPNTIIKPTGQRYTSPVWKYFGFEKKNDGRLTSDQTCCVICQHTIKYVYLKTNHVNLMMNYVPYDVSGCHTNNQCC